MHKIYMIYIFNKIIYFFYENISCFHEYMNILNYYKKLSLLKQKFLKRLPDTNDYFNPQ